MYVLVFFFYILVGNAHDDFTHNAKKQKTPTKKTVMDGWNSGVQVKGNTHHPNNSCQISFLMPQVLLEMWKTMEGTSFQGKVKS